MRLTIDFPDGYHPKRGDIVQTNVGDKRERTCMVWRVKKVNRIVHIHDPDPERATRDLVPRYKDMVRTLVGTGSGLSDSPVSQCRACRRAAGHFLHQVPTQKEKEGSVL